MSHVRIQGATWTLLGRLDLNHPEDEGGYGEVWAAGGPDGQEAAIKLVPKVRGAERELLIGRELAGVPGVVPVLGVGETAEQHAILMPRAEMSLSAYLRQSGPVDYEHLLRILLDIAEALAQLQERGVVHRDLKPSNVLLLGGRWCLSDFGIARYVAVATAGSRTTRKGRTTRPYAAPEIYREQRLTSAADVYAFGVIAFELVEGVLPFPGPEEGDFYEQHLHEAPPPAEHAPPALATLIEECLFKAIGARPTAANLVARLQRSTHSESRSYVQHALEAASLTVVRQHGFAGQDAFRAQTRHLSLQEEAEVGSRKLERIMADLRSTLTEHAGAARAIDPDRESPLISWGYELGEAKLGLREGPYRGTLYIADRDTLLGRRGTPETPDVCVLRSVQLAVRGRMLPSRWVGFGYSLAYCDLDAEGAFGWWEIGQGTVYQVSDYPLDNYVYLLPGDDPRTNPEARNPAPVYDPYPPMLLPDERLRGLAFVAYRFDAGNEQEFIDRWLYWFALAAQGELHTARLQP